MCATKEEKVCSESTTTVLWPLHFRFVLFLLMTHCVLNESKDVYSEFTWHPWLFQRAPQSFWMTRGTHRNGFSFCMRWWLKYREFLDWLAEENNINRQEDWYNVTTVSVTKNYGTQMLSIYNGSLSSALASTYPRMSPFHPKCCLWKAVEYEWKEWLFDKVPQNFWSSIENQRKYLNWLAEILNINEKNEWYSFTAETISSLDVGAGGLLTLIVIYRMCRISSGTVRWFFSQGIAVRLLWVWLETMALW